MGRPTKLTPELTAQITALIKQGISPTKSATYSGICASTFFQWMGKGRNAEVEFLEFSEAVERASAEVVVRCFEEINRACEKGNWRAAAWWLERNSPEEFGKESIGRRKEQRDFRSISEYSPERLEEQIHQIQLKQKRK